ncbi:hypothetical protein DYBT9275_06028 [Dyadobacter sp. CECT 9275]|uniref:Sialidase domain-containing protein n=1 Tax=Dyadobacter helix TaxID=2822344 RepID=A0A916JHV3_9BACT|nr:sialidase family protein [Dyadobacter sp. CECT 9275]CAG5018571.1 hypothetical protein DYBT9275_06028 [Dyadobacter sp. CECT 9275]
MKKITRVLIFALLTVAAALSGGDVFSQDHKAGVYAMKLPRGKNNPRNSEGDFVTLKDGRILFVYTHYTGTNPDDHGSAFLAGRYSKDGGKSWSTEDQMIVAQEGDMNVMSVSLLRLKNGKIALFYLRKNSFTDCIPQMRISSDEGKTWSNPTPCITDRKNYFVLNNNRVIQLKSGRLLMPVALHNTKEGGAFENQGIIYCYYSDDNGRNWTSSAEIPNTKKIITQEPGVIELKDGRIMMFIRTDSGVQQLSFSRDEGKTWSPIEPSKIASPLSPASIARIPSMGDLLLVWNNNDGKNPATKERRTPLTTAISKDEGSTWQNLKNIEDNPSGSFCYTAIHFTKDEVLLGYFDWATTQVTIRRLSLKWILDK